MKQKNFLIQIVFILILSLFQRALNASASDFSRAQKKERLIFAIDIIRHGDRTPCDDKITTKPYTWPEGLGQLTPLGMRQEYALGKKLRRRYVDKDHLLPSHYLAETMYVRSTDIDRTLMSAESFLMGLYPPGQGPYINGNFFQPALPNAYQPIPIHTVPREQETLLIPNDEAHHFEELLEKYVYSTTEWKQKEAEMKPFFSEWSHATGIPLMHCDQRVGLLGDTLFVRQKKHIPLPSALSKQEADKIIEISQWGLVRMFKNRIVGQRVTVSLRQKIALLLEQAVHQKTRLKYVLYSAHDCTILALASGLGAPLDKTPPYASDLNISLFDQENNSYRVVVTYNDQPLILPCTGTNSCSLEEFFQLTGCRIQ